MHTTEEITVHYELDSYEIKYHDEYKDLLEEIFKSMVGDNYKFFKDEKGFGLKSNINSSILYLLSGSVYRGADIVLDFYFDNLEYKELMSLSKEIRLMLEKRLQVDVVMKVITTCF